MSHIDTSALMSNATNATNATCAPGPWRPLSDFALASFDAKSEATFWCHVSSCGNGCVCPAERDRRVRINVSPTLRCRGNDRPAAQCVGTPGLIDTLTNAFPELVLTCADPASWVDVSGLVEIKDVSNGAAVHNAASIGAVVLPIIAFCLFWTCCRRYRRRQAAIVVDAETKPLAGSETDPANEHARVYPGTRPEPPPRPTYKGARRALDADVEEYQP